MVELSTKQIEVNLAAMAIAACLCIRLLWLSALVGSMEFDRLKVAWTSRPTGMIGVKW